MDHKLAVFYAILFLCNVCLYVVSAIKNRKPLWTTLFVCEVVCIAAAIGSMHYYDAPGFTNIMEVSCSLFATIAFVLLFGVSVISRDIRDKRERK